LRRIAFTILIALAGTFGLHSMTPSAHAQAIAPTVTVTPATIAVGGTATVSGQYFTPNYYAYVYYQRPDGSTGAVTVGTTPQGTFAFNLGFTAAHGTGSEFVSAYDYGTARWTAFTTVSVTSGAPVPAPYRHLFTTPGSVVVGGTVTVQGQSFGPNNQVYVYFVRPDGTAGAFWALTGAAGNFAAQLGFVTTHGCGTETIWAYDYPTAQWSAPTTVSVTGCGVNPGIGVPASPGNLQVVSQSVSTGSSRSASVTLRWADLSTNESGFRVHTTLYHLYGGQDSQTQEVGPNATTAQVSFVAGGINPVATACFTVGAYNLNGESAQSNQVCVQF
jgi:hypothetical protein